MIWTCMQCLSNIYYTLLYAQLTLWFCSSNSHEVKIFFLFHNILYHLYYLLATTSIRLFMVFLGSYYRNGPKYRGGAYKLVLPLALMNDCELVTLALIRCRRIIGPLRYLTGSQHPINSSCYDENTVHVYFRITLWWQPYTESMYITTFEFLYWFHISTKFVWNDLIISGFLGWCLSIGYLFELSMDWFVCQLTCRFIPIHSIAHSFKYQPVNCTMGHSFNWSFVQFFIHSTGYSFHLSTDMPISWIVHYLASPSYMSMLI
jgi:hypothetical protein